MEVKKLMLQNIRFGYEHLWEASAAEESAEKKFSVEIRIPKTDQKQIDMIQAAVDEFTDEIKKKAKNGKLPKDFKVWFFDGDDSDSEGYAGYMYFSAKSAKPVGIFGTQRDDNGKLKPLVREEFKAGDWGNASVGVFSFDKGNGGISFFLNGVQKKRDGEAIQQGVSSADFDGLEDDETDEDDLG